MNLIDSMESTYTITGPAIDVHGGTYDKRTPCETIKGWELLKRIQFARERAERFQLIANNMLSILEGSKPEEAA